MGVPRGRSPLAGVQGAEPPDSTGFPNVSSDSRRTPNRMRYLVTHSPYCVRHADYQRQAEVGQAEVAV